MSRAEPEAAVASSRSSAAPVAQVYVDRCKKLLETPPPAEWDGVYEKLAA